MKQEKIEEKIIDGYNKEKEILSANLNVDDVYIRNAIEARLKEIDERIKSISLIK